MMKSKKGSKPAFSAAASFDMMNANEETQPSGETEALSEPKHASKYDQLSPFSPKTVQMDRQRAKSLPADLYQDEASSHNRKRVQFADMMGLNLENVRHFSYDAYDTSALRNHPSNQELQQRVLPLFQLPVSLSEFDMKSRRLGVALESVSITASEVKGVIIVTQRHAGRREVGVRYTLNNWLTFADIQASPRMNEEELLWEQFDFTLDAPLSSKQDSSVHFAVYCRTDHGEYWDNNDGQNYCLRIQTT
ncbi:protein phosphatase 1 regulatory subunit 3G-like [Danio aesculapii]|uniref:protein phosphatase 1 regulatory subunit 3G-like n=1 Tax=Danio aesculapii TaxID=1142201 RepID=UPI0024C0506F|nr:protein phosphatase 1 regulatory subunit 3G-like [Danio aesculapii]